MNLALWVGEAARVTRAGLMARALRDDWCEEGGATHPFPSGDRNTEGVHSISQILPRQKGPTCSPLHLRPRPETANQIKKQTKSGRTPLVEREEDGGYIVRYLECQSLKWVLDCVSPVS